jgi:hypothetical protein
VTSQSHTAAPQQLICGFFESELDTVTPRKTGIALQVLEVAAGQSE